jgi:hypothetical protein
VLRGKIQTKSNVFCTVLAVCTGISSTVIILPFPSSSKTDQSGMWTLDLVWDSIWVFWMIIKPEKEKTTINKKS